MQLRKSIFNDIKGQPRLQKAVSLALYLKAILGQGSVLHNYTINKLHEKSGVSPTTLKKYLPILKKNKWIQLQGKHNQHLVISKLASHSQKRNISLDEFDFKSFKDTYNSLRAFLALAIQARKDFIRQTILSYHNPSNKKEFCMARKKVKRFVKMGVLNRVDSAYKEFGVSFKRIAQETGNCIRTAQRIIQFAIKRNWCIKHRHAEIYHLKGVGFRDTDGLFTYSTKDYLVLMHANSYTLENPISDALGMVSI